MTPASPLAMSGTSLVLTRLRASIPLLGPSERRVAEAILAAPVSVIDWSTSELAQAAGTSTATVSRACQSLGFRGFQHLRLEVARSAPVADPPHQHALDQIFTDAADAISLGRESLDLTCVEAAVTALMSANRLILVGSGFSAPPLQDAAMRFATVGRSVEAPSDILAQQFAATSLSTGDVCLTVSYSGANTHTLHACRAAKEGGATVIAVTSFGRSPLTQIADIALITSPLSRAHVIDPYLSRLSHQLVLHTLHAELSARSDTNSITMRRVVIDALEEDER